MIIDKLVEIKVGGRNFLEVVKLYPNIKKNDILSVSQLEAKNLLKYLKLDCICDNCGENYQQSGERMISMPMREDFCGKCRHKIGLENMTKTKRTEENRKKNSNIHLAFYQTEKGKQTKKEAGRKHSLWMQSHPEHIEKITRNLKAFCGENHPNYNPNKSEFKAYKYKVIQLSEKTYVENKELINPNNYPRTLCGVEGGYQLDHIFPIKRAFEKGWSEEKTSDIYNLQMLPWKINNQKRT